MPEDKNCKLLQTSRSCDSKKKKKKQKKKRKKATASTTPLKNTDKPPAGTSPVSLRPPQSPGPGPVRAQLPKLRERSRKDSPAPRTATNRTSSVELSVRARESLRWEGALEDPRAEEQRLELYRANRRQRYRDALIQDSNGAVRYRLNLTNTEEKQQWRSLGAINVKMPVKEPLKDLVEHSV